MSDTINAGDINESKAVAIGDGASSAVNEGTMVGAVMGNGTVNAQNIAGGDINITNNLPQPRPDEVSNLHPFNLNFVGRQTYLQQIAANFGTTAAVDPSPATPRPPSW